MKHVPPANPLQHQRLAKKHPPFIFPPSKKKSRKTRSQETATAGCRSWLNTFRVGKGAVCAVVKTLEILKFFEGIVFNAAEEQRDVNFVGG